MKGTTTIEAMARPGLSENMMVTIPVRIKRSIEHVDDTVGKQLLQRVDVVDDTHEDRPGRAPIKKVKRQVLDVTKQLFPHVPQDLLTDPVGQLNAHPAASHHSA